MRLISLRFRNVGPFGPDGVRLDDLSSGLNVVSETNEFGKSTILKALELFLFKPFSSADRDVKALKTEGTEAGPEGEIEFEADGRRYTLAKTYLKRKSCTLSDASGTVIASDRTAEDRLKTLLRSDEFDRGPSGLLWVRQGDSMASVDDDGQVASRLEGELTTLVGGDRARDFLARVEAELAENLTRTGKEKSNGALKAARDALARTQADLDQALATRATTREIGQALADVRAEIERLEADSQGDDTDEQIRDTRAQLATATAFQSELRRLESERDRAADKADRAREAQDAHVEALAQFNRWTEERATLEAAQVERETLMMQTTADREAQKHQLSELEDKAGQALAARQNTDEIAQLASRQDALARETAFLAAQRDEYDELDRQLADLNDRIDDMPDIARAHIEPLRRLADRARQADADIAALSTRLHLELNDGAQDRVSIDGQALTSGPFELRGGATLSIVGVGRIRSDGDRLAELTTERDESRAAYQTRLESHDVANLAEATAAANARHDLEQDRKRLVADMTKLAPQGADALRSDLAKREETLRDLADRLTDIQAAKQDAGEEMDETALRQELNAARGRLDAVDHALSNLREAQARSAATREGLDERIAALALPDSERERTQQADRYAADTLAAKAALRVAEAAVGTAQTSAPSQSPDMLAARLERLEQVGRQTRDRLEELKRREASLGARRDAAFEGEDADARVGTLEARAIVQAEDLARLERRVAAQTLLRDTLKAAQSRLREAYTEPVRAELAPLLARVIPGAEAGLSERLGTETVRRNGRVEDVAQLSGGTREQIAILTRLAFARLLKRGGASAPVILDDALVYADDRRRDDMFDVLNHVASGEDGLQILYLSCHASATRKLGGHMVTPESWAEDAG